MKIKEMLKHDRPREKLIKYGVDKLTNEELLSIILKTGIKDKSVKELSKEIMEKVSNISNLKECSINYLLDIKGIGITKACEILSAIELGKRIYLFNEAKFKLTSPKEVYDYIRYYITDLKQEYFYCIYLNNKNEVIERRLLFMGTVNRSIVHPREVFKFAYLSSASGIICVHNHPSGDVIPSREDIDLTKGLIEIGRIQAIPILDHIIVSKDKYYSMQESLELFL